MAYTFTILGPFQLVFILQVDRKGHIFVGASVTGKAKQTSKIHLIARKARVQHPSKAYLSYPDTPS